LLNSRLTFNFYTQISCKNDLNNFLFLNTNGPLILKMCLKVLFKYFFCKREDSWYSLTNVTKLWRAYFSVHWPSMTNNLTSANTNSVNRCCTYRLRSGNTYVHVLTYRMWDDLLAITVFWILRTFFFFQFNHRTNTYFNTVVMAFNHRYMYYHLLFQRYWYTIKVQNRVIYKL